MSTITMIHGDCMEALVKMEDNQYSLCIVDPPYGLQKTGNLSRMNGAGKLKNRAINNLSCEFDKEPPSGNYFNLLKSKSENQIIWGGNYFNLPPTRGIVCWDKEQPWENFSAWEMAWTSFNKPAKIFREATTRTRETKIHPTQKSVKLYKWLLANYAKAGDTILDTHGGSGSICIACIDMGFDLVWIEKDRDYYDSAVARVKKHNSQLDMFIDQAEIWEV